MFAYNAAADPFEDGSDALPQDLAGHGAHPFMNLYESNIGADIALDNIWGSSSHNTFFRNAVTDQSDPPGHPVTSGLVAVGIQYANRMISLVGNVLGTPAMGTPRSQYECGQAKYDYPCAYRIGYRCDSGDNDPRVNATLYRHCNYDYVTNTTGHAPGVAGCALPASLFRSSPPPFFCKDTPWPVVGADVSPMVGKLPALQRLHDLMAGRNYSCAHG